MSADQRPSSAKRTSSASGAAKKSPTPAAQQQQQQQAHTSTSPTPFHLKAAQMPSDRLTAPLPSASLPSPPRTESWDDPRQMASSSSSSSSSRRSTLGGAAASSSSAIHAARPMQEHATYDSTSNSIYAYQPHHHQHTAAAAAAAAAAQLQAAATFGVASSSSATSPTHSFVPSPMAVPYSPAAINGTAVSSALTAEWPPGSIADDNFVVGGGSEGGPTNGTLADSGSGSGAGGSSNGGGAPALTAPYPGRAASLPGSIHYPQSARSRSAMPASSRESTAGQGFGANSSSSGTSSSTKFRDNPQLRAQIAQQVANGTLPPAMLSHHQQSHQSQQQHHHQQSQQPAIPYERYTAELTNCIIAFLSPMLPTEEEYRMKEATRRQLERLTGKVSPGAKLLAFGSMANGFALRNSDMDLCCLIASKSTTEDNEGKEAQPTPPPQLSASELVERLAEVIRAETDYKVLPLPKARIPIIKLSRASSSEFPYEISCDIGFENRLALENTRLLLSYAMVDPPRLRTLVLFLKVWTKRRKLNTPFMGTLSSYGYTLLVLFFLCHVKRPAVLPNLQRIPPTRPLTPDEVQLNGHNIYFYDDMATLRKEWQSQNQENVAELLIDFFRYFAKEFVYSRDVISLRTEGGLIPKDGGVWSAELCIEDPFQLGYNVSRTVTKDGLYTIRGEFMRAMRILQNRGQRVSAQLAELCEEREDIVARAPDTPPPRHRYMPTSHHAPYYVDARTMRELYYDAMPPRRTSHHVQPSGHGGSFAFEEMARGLGRQRSQMAYPSQAMLAPLSQQGGLSPKPVHRAPPSADESPTKSTSSSNGSTKGASAGAGRSTTKAASSLRHQQSADDSEGEREVQTELQQEDGSPGGASSSRQSSTLHSTGSDDDEDDGASSVSTATTATGAGVEAHQQQQQRAEQGSSATGPSAAEEKESRRSSRPKQQAPSTPALAARPPSTAHQRRSSSPSSSKRRPPTLSDPDDPPHLHNSAALPQHASARTSPNLNPTVPPQAIVDAADGQGGRANDDVGEAWAFGSEIVFGSERFRLHPHPHHHHHYHQHQFQHQQHQQQQQQHRRQTSAGQQTMPGMAATDPSGSEKQGSTTTTKAAARDDAASTPSPETAHRTSRALSDGGGINRSMSLPPRRHYNSVAPKSTLPPSEAGGSDDEGDDVAAAPAADDSIDDFRSISGASASASVLSLAESSSRAGSAAPKEEPRPSQQQQQQQQSATPQQQEGEGEANGQPPMAEYTAEWAQKQFAQQQQERAGKDEEGKADEGDEGDETIVLPPMPTPQSPSRSQQPSSKQQQQQQQQQPGKQTKKQRKASTSSSVASSSASRPHANGKASHA